MIKDSIVLVPFPFDDFSVLKVRPALCLTTAIGKHQHVIIAFISSKVSSEMLESDIVISEDSDFWEGTGLSTNSVLKLHKLVTVPKSLIKRKLGVINDNLKIEVRQRISSLFF